MPRMTQRMRTFQSSVTRLKAGWTRCWFQARDASTSVCAGRRWILDVYLGGTAGGLQGEVRARSQERSMLLS